MPAIIQVFIFSNLDICVLTLLGKRCFACVSKIRVPAELCKITTYRMLVSVKGNSPLLCMRPSSAMPV